MAKLSVRNFSETDLNGYLELSQLEYGVTVSSDPEHIRWKHLNSEFGASLYVNLAETERVIGRALIHPRNLRTSLRNYKLGQVMDLLIDKAHRTTPANFINLTKACGNIEDFDLVFHTSNERSFPLYSKLFRFPNPFSLNSYGFPVRLAGIFSLFIGRRINVIDVFTAPFRWFLLAMSYAVNFVVRLEITENLMSDDEIETLCAKCLRKSGSHLTRSNAFLNWRFRDAPIWPAMISRVDRKGHFLGYVVTRKVVLDGQSHFVLMDFILDPTVPYCASFSLRLWLIRKAILSCSDVFFTMANPFSNIASKCIGFPFINIPEKLLPHATPIFMRARTNDSDQMESDQSIHLTLADLDYF
ncbi:hypothetical protein N8Z34_02595 [Oceanospirillaceae bacterium]|nr:hypothetical protein [Oceanospirillaceae bacterium]